MLRTWLTDLRNSKNLDRSVLAKKLNVSPQAIAYWESGAKSPSRKNAYALASILGPEVHTFLAAEVQGAA